MNQLSLFDLAEAIQAREEAIARVDLHADEMWKQSCREAIIAVASIKAEFTTDDIWEWMFVNGVDQPHENRAMGAVIRESHKSGIIKPTDRYLNSLRPECHRRPIKIWLSLIF